MSAVATRFDNAGSGGVRKGVRYESIVSAAVWIFLFCGSISLIEPSPYDFMSLVAIPLWFFGGFRLHRALILILAFWTINLVNGYIALTPYWHEPDPRLYQFQSLYLFVTVVFFTIYFSERSEARLENALRAFTAGCLFSAAFGVAGYLNIGGLSQYTLIYESRIAGTFKDPNVFGSYLIIGVVFLAQSVILGTARNVWLTTLGLAILLAGVLLSFSRGSWGATVIALAMLGAVSFATTTGRVRQRVMIAAIACLVLATLIIVVVLADSTTRELFAERFTATKEYDVGATGRFGNQIRSLIPLLSLPMGYGPLRFRLVYDLEPHNSYIGAFANYGWFGGFLWIFLVAATCWIGFRLMFTPSPLRRHAQVVFPATFVILLQGFQIDVDHWRQLFLCFGAVWGMEVARIRMIERGEVRPAGVASG